MANAPTNKREADAQAELVRLRADLEIERRHRKQEAASARERERTLRERLERLERKQGEAAAVVRESAQVAASAAEGDVLRQRVAQLEFGVGYVELGPVPAGATVVIRVRPGSTSSGIMATLRELACLVADDQVPLEPRRGSWELVRAQPEHKRSESDEVALAVDELRAELGDRAAELPTLLRTVREALSSRAARFDAPASAEGDRAAVDAAQGPQEGAPAGDGAQAGARPDEGTATADTSTSASVEGTRRQRARQREHETAES